MVFKSLEMAAQKPLYRPRAADQLISTAPRVSGAAGRAPTLTVERHPASSSVVARKMLKRVNRVLEKADGVDLVVQMDYYIQIPTLVLVETMVEVVDV